MTSRQSTWRHDNRQVRVNIDAMLVAIFRINQQYKAILNQDNYFQTDDIGNRATRCIWINENINKRTLIFYQYIASYLSLPTNSIFSRANVYK